MRSTLPLSIRIPLVPQAVIKKNNQNSAAIPSMVCHTYSSTLEYFQMLKLRKNGIIIAGALKFLFKWNSRCLDKAHHEKTRVAIYTDELQLTRQKCVRVCAHACMRVCVHACVRVLMRGEVTSDTGLFIFSSGTIRNRQYDCSKVLMTSTVA